MADLLGPANAPNAVSARPDETRVFGGADTFFKDCTSPAARDGTALQSGFLNGLLQQARRAIRGRAIVVDNTDDDMLLKAIKSMLRYGVDVGAANALVTTFSPPLAGMEDGIKVLVKIAFNNTTTSTLNPNGLGAKTIVGRDGLPIDADDLIAGMIAEFVIIGDQFQLTNAAAGSGGSSGAYVTGDVIVTLADTPPTGTIEANGAAISRTTYANLFARYGTKYGVGNGTTTFNLPDLRGYFLRGWDHGAGRDPDVASRTNRGDGTTGDNVGTKQMDAFQGHWHQTPQTDFGIGNTGGSNGTTWNQTMARDAVTGVHGDVRVSTETRAKNINALFCIAY